MTGHTSYVTLPVGAFLDALADRTAGPAAGSAAALAVAQAAALCGKVARLSARQLTAARAGALTEEAEVIRAAVTPLIDEDPLAFRAVLEARNAAAAGATATAGTTATAGAGAGHPDLAEALSGATDVPVRIAEHAAQVAELAAALAAGGNPALRGDAVAAALLAEAGARAAVVLVRINLAACPADHRLAAVTDLYTRIAGVVSRVSSPLAPDSGQTA